jgi:RNA polymerase sigma-70 factor, ECF subfamily
VVEITEYVRDCYPRLVRRAYLLTGDRAAAEDLVQDCLTRCIDRTGRGSEVANLDAYLGRALVNAAISRWRRPAHTREVLTGTPAGGGMVGDLSEEVVERDRMWRALQAAPARQRAVLVLRYYEDLPEAEVAALLGVSVGTVRSQSSRGLARIRLAMSDSEPVGGRP